MKRAFGWAAGSSESGVHSLPCQSIACAGGSAVMPSHHTSPSSVLAQLVKIVLASTAFMAFGLVSSPVPGATPKKPGLGVDGVEPAVVAELHPGDVVADRLDLPALQRRDQHREVGLATALGKAAVMNLTSPLGRGELEDQHVLGQPALVARRPPRRSAARSTSCRAAHCRRSPSRRTRSRGSRGSGRCTSPLVARPRGVAARRANRVHARHEGAPRHRGSPAPACPCGS